MARQVGVTIGSVVEYCHVGGDDGMGAKIGSAIDCSLLVRETGCLRIGVQSDEYFTATFARSANSRGDLCVREVESRERPRVCLVAETDINGVCAGIERGVEGWKIAGRAY